jgi:hypothetical protein
MSFCFSQRSETTTKHRSALLMLCGILVACGTPSTWSERGPALGGRLSAIVAVPGTNGSVLIAASPGGGVWRSVDGGASWTFPNNYGTGDFSVVHLEWDAVTPGRLYGLSYSGLHATTDRGDNWTALIGTGGVPAPLLPYQTAIADPKPFAQMKFAAAQGAVFASIPCSGLYYSFDGVHFTQNWPFTGGSANPDNCIGNIAADAVSGRVYFSTLASGPWSVASVYRSDCGATHWAPGTPCLTWVPANGGLPTYAIMSTLVSAAAPGAGDRLVAQTNGTSSNASTYLTTNGTSWSLQSTRTNRWSLRALLYTGTGSELLEGSVLTARSTDFGANWTDFGIVSTHPDTRALYADATAGKLWTVTDGSSDGGTYANVTRWNWAPGSAPSAGANLGHAGLTVWQVYYAAVVPVPGGGPNARRVFLGSQDNAGQCSDSLGAGGWTASGEPPGSGSGDYFAFQSAPSDANRAYAWSGQTVKFARTTNASSAANCAAVSWTEVTPTHNPAGAQLVPPGYWSHHAMAVDPTNPDRLYFAFLNDVGVSTNAGAATPLVTHHTLPGNYQPTTIYGDSTGAIYVGTAGHGAYVSTDDGQHWTPWGLNTNSPVVIAAITSSGGVNPTYWIAGTSGLYRRQGAGAWTLSTGGDGYIVNDVKIDPACGTRVYTAFGFGAIRGQHRGGIRVTSNNGASWTSITSGQALHQAPVTSVQIDPLQPRSVYAASYGRGFWVFDWGSYLPACVP